MKNRFYLHLQSLIKKNHISQRAFAFSIGVSPAIVTFWIKGERQPTADNLYRIAEEYRVSIDLLLGSDDFCTAAAQNESEALLLEYNQLSLQGKQQIKEYCRAIFKKEQKSLLE